MGAFLRIPVSAVEGDSFWSWVSSSSMSTDWARLARGGRVDVSAVSAGSETVIMSTSSFSSASKLDALLFSGEEERCGISSAPPIIALCEGSRGDWALASASFGASEDLLHSKLWLSPLSMDRPAYAALGEL